VHVVGIGADGWSGLPDASRAALLSADVVVGGPRQLALLDDSVTATRTALPAPLLPSLGELLARADGEQVAVLASGDPMFFGIGSTLIGLGVDVRVHAAPSSVSLACARLGWAVQDVDVVSAVGRPLSSLHPFLQPGRRVLVLVGSEDGADSVRSLLDARGFGSSAVTVLEQLGGPHERVSAEAGPHDRLAIVALECVADPDALLLPRVPGLPEAAFDTDGQITKREVRAFALAALAPVPGQLLWDVGAGSGSIGIEWMRVHPSSRAIAIEPREDRRGRIARNADALGVPGLQVVAGAAPDALAGLPTPDAVFVGGGVTAPGVLDACTAALLPGGRLVCNAVTLEGAAVLAAMNATRGGALTRIAIERAEPIGGLTGWRPARAVTQWAWRKP